VGGDVAIEHYEYGVVIGCGSVEACFRDKFISGVGAECEEGGEASGGGCVWGACATHDDGADADVITWPVSAESAGQGGALS
jgi:hypothetical protein